MAVKTALLFHKQRPLLALAVSKLRPNIFSHPVWIRFGKKDKVVSPETIQNLFGEAEQLQCDHPGDACQVLLICAVYQNYSGQSISALATIEKALDLAQHAGLSQEIPWTLWGACAVCVQQGNYEQAAILLGQLQAVLNVQNEWILADYIDVMRQFLIVAAAGTDSFCASPETQKFEGLLTITFEWLHQWGFSARPESCLPLAGYKGPTGSPEPFTRADVSGQRQLKPWHILKLIFQGELKLYWAKKGSHPADCRSSLWGSILSSLQIYFSGRKITGPLMGTDAHVPGVPTPQKVNDNPLPDIIASKREIEVKDKPVYLYMVLQQMNTVIPVSVHMLGRFVMSTQGVILKLPVSRSLSLLKYVMLNHKQNTPREVLMDVFWPDAGTGTARNNLNVAMHAIRRTLRTGIDQPVILYRDGSYSISPDIQVWLDVEEFERLISAGHRLESRNQSAAVSEYEAA